MQGSFVHCGCKVHFSNERKDRQWVDRAKKAKPQRPAVRPAAEIHRHAVEGYGCSMSDGEPQWRLIWWISNFGCWWWAIKRSSERTRVSLEIGATMKMQKDWTAWLVARAVGQVGWESRTSASLWLGLAWKPPRGNLRTLRRMKLLIPTADIHQNKLRFEAARLASEVRWSRR